MVRKAPAQLITHDDDETEVVFETGDPYQPKPETAQQKSFEAVLDEMSDFNGEAFLHVHRQTGNGQEAMEQIGVFPVDQFASVPDLLAHVAESYGGGRYRIKLFQQGRKGCLANKLYTVAEPRIKKSDGPNSNDSIAILAEQMRQQNQLLMRVLQQQAQPQQTTSRREMLEEVALIAGMFSGNGGNSRGISQIASDIQALQGLGLNFGLPSPAAPEKEEGFGDIIEKAAPILQAAFSQPSQPQKPKPVQENPEMLKQMMIRREVGKLVNAAKQGVDPGIMAEKVIDDVPPKVIKDFISNPSAYNDAIKSFPECAPNRPWFDDLLEHLKAHHGLPSKFSHLYSDGDDDINGEISDTDSDSPNDVEGTDIPTA